MCAGCARQFNNLSSGNPDLKPQHAWNYDLLGEHFFPGAGVLSGGVFYKQISDFIYVGNFVYGGPVPDFQGYYGTRPQNGGRGHLAGLEVTWTQRFLALPGALAAGPLLGRQVLGSGLQLDRVGDQALVAGRQVEGPQAGDRLGAAAAAQEHDSVPVGGDRHAARGAEGEPPRAGLSAGEAVGHGDQSAGQLQAGLSRRRAHRAR